MMPHADAALDWEIKRLHRIFSHEADISGMRRCMLVALRVI
jgi:hypothetical protein